MPVPGQVFMGHKYISKDEAVEYLETQVSRMTLKGNAIGAEAATAVLGELKDLTAKALAVTPFDMMGKIETARAERGY